MDLLKRIEWKFYREFRKLKLKNKNPTIISSNCNGTIIYYDLNLRFNSPTINLSFDMNEYVKFLENLNWYLEQPLVDITNPDTDSYPIGRLYDITIRFNHYKTFDEAFAKWEQRKKRIDLNNLYILGIDGDNCTYESIKKFDQLPFKNKVIFTHKPYPEFKSTYYIKGFENDNCVGTLIYFKKQFFIRRYIDDFNYVKFLNQ